MVILLYRGLFGELRRQQPRDLGDIGDGLEIPDQLDGGIDVFGASSTAAKDTQSANFGSSASLVIGRDGSPGTPPPGGQHAPVHSAGFPRWGDTVELLPRGNAAFGPAR
jgi:hypothetical protein